MVVKQKKQKSPRDFFSQNPARRIHTKGVLPTPSGQALSPGSTPQKKTVSRADFPVPAHSGTELVWSSIPLFFQPEKLDHSFETTDGHG
jgi:hypothetical protein